VAQDQEPVSLEPRFFEALVYYIEGRFGEAKKLLREILNLNADYRPRSILLKPREPPVLGTPPLLPSPTGKPCCTRRIGVIEFLEKSAADHEPRILYLKVASDFTEERRDPRYMALERRVGLLEP